MENSIQSYDRVSQPPERSRLFDHLIRPIQHRLRNRESDLLRRFQIDHQLKLSRLLDRKISGLRTFEDFVDVGCSAPEQVGTAHAVCHAGMRR